MRRRSASVHGFTLIELLVVVAIIAILVAITLPALSRARESARRIACAANLKSVGQAIQQYLSEYNNFYPPMAPMPTIESTSNPTAPRPPMDWVLGKYVGVSLDQKYPGTPFVDSNYAAGHPDVFACPSDTIRESSVLAAMAAEGKKLDSYFTWQGSSFEPRIGLSVVKNGYWMLSRENSMIGQNQKTEEIEELFQNAANIMIVHEYEPFHVTDPGDDSDTAGCNVLFADFHVAAM